jgi:chromate reductase, NAD(P)H dehydrogenase (quinone)
VGARWTVHDGCHGIDIDRDGTMTRILGISGSLRRGSYNTALLRAAAGLVDGGVELEVASIHGIPLYDGDVETAEGIPPAVQALKARVLACDGLLLATPEYNNGIPGVFKNAIDWLSRPASEIAQVFGGRPVAVIGASPGGFGTILSQDAWWPVLRTLRTRPWFGGRLMVSRAGSVFDAEGRLVDEKLRGQLQDFMAGFAQFVAGSDDAPA